MMPQKKKKNSIAIHSAWMDQRQFNMIWSSLVLYNTDNSGLVVIHSGWCCVRFRYRMLFLYSLLATFSRSTELHLKLLFYKYIFASRWKFRWNLENYLSLQGLGLWKYIEKRTLLNIYSCIYLSDSKCNVSSLTATVSSSPMKPEMFVEA